MELGTAAAAISTHVEGVGSVNVSRELSAQERIFVDAFIGNGGNASAAVVAAGYSEKGADVQACRLLCRTRVAEHIKNQCGKFAHSALPVAIRTLVEIAGDAEALRKDRIKAANSLIELAGMGAPKGGINVNVGIVNGSQAQQIISEVHDARARRLSDIPPAMPDKSLRQIEQTIDLLSEPEVDHAGGDHLQGPAVASGPVPASSSANSSEIGNSPSDPFKAFDSSQGDDE